MKNDSKISLKNFFQPNNVKTVLKAARDLTGYNPIRKTYNVPSLALHMGPTLKKVAEELDLLIRRNRKGFQYEKRIKFSKTSGSEMG